MRLQFEKKGKTFTVEVAEGAVTVNGHKVTTTLTGRGWAYVVGGELAKELSGKATNLYLLHDSADKARNIAQEQMDEIERERMDKRNAERRPFEVGRRHRALVSITYNYLTEYKLSYVVKCNEEEQQEYAEWFKPRAHLRSVDDETIELKHSHGPVVSSIIARQSQGSYPSGESSIWYITDEEEEEVLAEVEAIEQAEVKEKELKKAAREAERKAKFDEAHETGEPVILRMWSEDCDDPREECSLDNIVEYAMPDGSVKTVRSHTY